MPENATGPLLFKSTRNVSPLTVSRGIITKRGPMVEEVKAYSLVYHYFTIVQIPPEGSGKCY